MSDDPLEDSIVKVAICCHGCQDEWEQELERLTSRFERELQTKRKRPDEQQVLTLRLQQERADLEKNMTLRRDRKKESLTRKMLEHERYV